MAKVLLISPPYMRFMGYSRFYYPIGLASIAAVLDERRHEVLIYDADHNNDGSMLSAQELMGNYNNYLAGMGNLNHPIWEEMKKVILSYKPDYIGISIYTDVFPISKLLINLIRDIIPDAKIIVGGPHATLCPEDFLTISDYIVLNEGEFAVLDIIEGKAKKGILQGNRICDLDSMPFPAIDKLYGIETYTKRDLSIIISGRGCPNKCKFCNSYDLWSNKLIRKSPNYLIKEIQNVRKNYNVTDFYITDDIFTYNEGWLNEFCNYAKQIEISWRCLSHINYIDSKRVDIMKDSGCRNIKFGIESGSQSILDKIDKDLKVEKILEISHMLQEKCMDWSAFFIIGFPGETINDIKKTQDLIKKISAKSITVNIYTPLPKNRLGTNCDYTLGKYSFHSPYNNFTGCIDDETFNELICETLAMVNTAYNEHVTNKQH